MIKTAVLCGGRGVRLRPITDQIPKPLIPLNGKPILEHVISQHLRRGCHEFVVCLGYRGQAIRDFFSEHSFEGTFDFSDAGESSSILQRIAIARPSLGDRFFVTYGDTCIDVDLKEMLEQHMKQEAAVTITTAYVQSPFGIIEHHTDNWVRSFEEKPRHIYFVGHMLMESSVIDKLDENLLSLPDGQGLIQLFQSLIEQNKLSMNFYHGPQITFNTHLELAQAEKDFLSFFTYQEE